MPWVQVISTENLFGCRFVPYNAEDSSIPQRVHEVVGCYRSGSDRAVARATLIEVDGNLISAVDEAAGRRAFRAASFVAFAALLRRVHFSRTGYVNSDAFRVVVEPCGDTVAVTTNRRSGSLTRVWGREDYRVHRPEHVADGVVVSPDPSVLRALAAAASTELWADIIDEVLLQLLRAESDDPQVTELMQLMLFSGSIQRLLEMHQSAKKDQLSPAIEKLFATATTWQAQPASASNRPPVAAQRHTLREAWYRDFYQTRHDYAHGRIAEERKPHWSVQEHLLMASFVVPRLMLLRLQESSYALTATDNRELRGIDRVLYLDNLFGRDGDPGAERWHWQEAFRVLTTVVNPDKTETDTMWPRAEPLDHSQFSVESRRL